MSSSDRFLSLLSGERGRLEDYGDRIERNGRVDPEILNFLFDSGLMRMTIPDRWGGAGMSVTEYLPVLRRVAGFHGSIRMFVHGMNGVWRPLETYGTEEQKREWLPIPSRNGLIAFALTEVEAGTGRDVATTAELTEGEWRLTGAKNLISWASIAEIHYVIARTGVRVDGSAEISCIIVPAHADGVRYESIPDGMGLHGSIHDRVYYEGVRVPAGNLLGQRGDGLAVASSFLDVSRLGIATSLLGIASRALEMACEFAQTRMTFGKPIASRQAIQMSVGESAAELFALQSAITSSAQKYDHGEPILHEAAMCKLLGMEIGGRVTDRALRMFGGAGYLGGHRIERLYRDTRAMWFEEGTAEIQKLVSSRPYLDRVDRTVTR